MSKSIYIGRLILIFTSYHLAVKMSVKGTKLQKNKFVEIKIKIRK